MIIRSIIVGLFFAVLASAQALAAQCSFTDNNALTAAQLNSCTITAGVVISGDLNLYVSKAATAADTGYCLTTAAPCLTVAYALRQGLGSYFNGGNLVINFLGTGDWAEDVFLTNPLSGAANTTAVPNIGTVWPSMLVLNGNGASNTTLSGTGNTCATVAASNNAIIGVENMTVTSSKLACADSLFAQLGGGINVFGGMTFGASGSSGCKMHAENSAYGIQIWQAYTLTGNGTCGYSAGNLGNIIIGAGVGTITGNPTFSELVFVGPGGTFQTNIANPWGASPGAMTGGGFIVAPGGSIASQGLAIAWPGNGTSYLEGGAYDQPPAPAVTSDANIGAGGTVALLSGSTPYSGVVVITTAGVPGSAGVLTITFATPFSIRRANGATTSCAGFILGSGSGVWQPGAIVQGSAIAGGAFTLTWQNIGTGLTTAKTYVLQYACNPG